MKKSDVEKLRGMLEQQLRVLQADAGNLNAVTNSAALADVNDQATLESERSFELRIKDRERKLIGKVQDALRKMADGSYGICESCGEPISVKRLQARPVTTYCINCKAEQEAEEKREEVLAQSSERAL
jgi:DnaK suppressor protein